MNGIGMIHIIFDLSAIVNIILAGWSAIEWGISFKTNHSPYRWLYSLWMTISILLGVIYLTITLNDSHGPDILNAPLYMVILRPTLTLVLSVSAITSEIMRGMRLRMKKYGE